MRAFLNPIVDPFAPLPGIALAHDEFLPAQVRLAAPVSPLTVKGRARWNSVGGCDLQTGEEAEPVLYTSYPAHRVLSIEWLAEDAPTYLDESDPEREVRDAA